MNPTSGENQPNFEIPSDKSGNERRQEKAMEERPGQSQEPSAQKKSVQDSSAQATSIALPAQSVIKTDDSDKSSPKKAAASPAAHDSDRIEKEWVERAKAVVARTSDDPFKQKNAMSQVKAEYIQKRFNKTIKTDDTVAR